MEQEENQSNSNNSGIGIGSLIVLGLIWWFFWGRQTTTWQGFYYPSAGNLTYDIKSPIYKTLEECRNWVNSMVYKYNPSGEGYDYECGKNCKIEKGMTVSVCDTTER